MLTADSVELSSLTSFFFFIAMDEDDEEETPSVNGVVNGHSDGRNEASKAPARLSYEEYIHMSNLMIIHIRSEEEKREGKKQHTVQADIATACTVNPSHLLLTSNKTPIRNKKFEFV